MAPIDFPVKSAAKSIDFLIIGGGLTGLMCAITLRTVGHRVTLVEKVASVEEIPAFFRGMMLPPNMTKLYNRWGMEDITTNAGLASVQLILKRWETGDLLGIHKWDQEMLEESGGKFTYLTYPYLWTTLLNTAKELGADIRLGTEAVSVGEDGQSVELNSGETLNADVVVGAGGPQGICRKLLAKYHGPPTPTGRAVYVVTIAAERMHADPELAEFVKYDAKYQRTWFGHNYGTVTHPTNAEGDYALYIHAPEGDTPLSPQWTPVAKEEVMEWIATAEPRVKKLVSLSSAVCRAQLAEYEDLEDWVADNGHVVVVGEEAHPYPNAPQPGPVNSYAMGVEDAAVLATLFSHLHDEEQIPSLLHAFQELRQERCLNIRLVDVGNIHFITLPDGREADERDKALRARQAAGRNVLLTDVNDAGIADLWTEHRVVFGYDALGEADNWWVQWGLLRERAQRPDIRGLGDMVFGHGVRVMKEVVLS
ncbi:FAD/NAD-P-binding domain-containing protein [Amylostereum chailletii]|nr:FAD/NAD-P-binding domain-containing protein [Amylostereum chailletii]